MSLIVISQLSLDYIIYQKAQLVLDIIDTCPLVWSVYTKCLVHQSSMDNEELAADFLWILLQCIHFCINIDQSNLNNL